MNSDPRAGCRVVVSGSKPTVRLPWSAVIFLVVMGIVAVTRRTLVLIWPARFGATTSNPAAAFEAGFARHAALTFVPLLPELGLLAGNGSVRA